MKTELEMLGLIYQRPGIHIRAISRELKIGMPSIKYALNNIKKKKLITTVFEGRNLKCYINFKNRLIIPCLYSAEYSRLSKLPKRIQNAIFDYLEILERKPLLALIFGSYAKDNYDKNSDLDILLIFDYLRTEIEKPAEVVGNRYGTSIAPIELSWEEFNKKFFDRKDKFMKQIIDNKIIINGIEWWVMLENEI